MVHPYEDSDSSEDEVDWQDTRNDPYRAGINSFSIQTSAIFSLTFVGWVKLFMLSMDSLSV